MMMIHTHDYSSFIHSVTAERNHILESGIRPRKKLRIENRTLSVKKQDLEGPVSQTGH
jgi:hypothetical protein